MPAEGCVLHVRRDGMGERGGAGEGWIIRVWEVRVYETRMQ